MENKYYIVGAGIVGCVIARELANAGADIEMWERRIHLGGNLYDYNDEHGIHVHQYGPHIFHTKIERVWNYVSKYVELKDFNLVCGSVIDGKCVPTSFDFESVDTFFPEKAEQIKEHINKVFKGRSSASILELLECDDAFVKEFAQFLYDKDYAPYTAKQWGISPDKVDRQIFKRVPVLFSYGSKYFDDPYQAMPVNGYMELINNLLASDNITIKREVDALEHLSIQGDSMFIDNEPLKGSVIYTGPIDELFGCKYGKLPYRSLRFEWKHEDIDSFQEMPVVAYPEAEGFTRITEYKKLPLQDVRGTTYAIEYPLPYKQGENNEPYYPVLTDESKELYGQYRELADNVKGLICCGRLADFKYYNIDVAINRALEIADLIKEG